MIPRGVLRGRILLVTVFVALLIGSLFVPLAASEPPETAVSSGESVEIAETQPSTLSDTAGSDDRYQVVQGDQTIELSPITGDVPVEEFYDYRHPYRDGGDEDHPRWGRSYSSEGTVEYQQDDTSILMLYEGPDGLSLVAVHDRYHEEQDEGTTGGSVSWNMTGLPDNGEWAVIDDDYGWLWEDGDKDALFYFDEAHTAGAAGNDGEPPAGVDAMLSWVWMTGRTDGMAYRILQDEFSITIDPAFNEQSYHRLGDDRRSPDGPDDPSERERYNGTVDDWQVIVPTDDGSGFERVSIERMDEPITVEPVPDAKQESAVSVRSLELDSVSIEPGETAELTAILENTGDDTVEYDAIFEVGETELDRTAVEIPPDSEREVSFSQQFETPGEYVLRVGDQQVTLTVGSDGTGNGSDTAGDAVSETVERVPGFGVRAVMPAAVVGLVALAVLTRRSASSKR